MATETALTETQIHERLTQLPGWRYDQGMIRRSYKTDGWPTTLMLVNAIGFFAEAADHHPDLKVSWGAVEVAFSTHSAGGITDKDFELARQVEQTALWRPGAGSSLRGTPKKFVARDGA
ncbi:MAG TPA: 4a-hydroxytetrahydrobiopterin dehydratase [Gemmatimonadales bacterium]|nr:4a-hydroxytetrahydrobiopterin dehydratase [Gemmatimonadales bacterium]